MDRYHIGQRVQIIDHERTAEGSTEFLGRFGTVRAPKALFKTLSGRVGMMYVVHVEGMVGPPGSGMHERGFFLFMDHELEAVYDGWKPTQWENCAWQPAGFSNPRRD
jgi:hypothetical protein